MAEIPRSKAGKQRKVARTMREFKAGDLESSSGQKVTNPKQAVAIALSQSGQAKRQAKPPAGQTNRLARAISRRVDQGADKAKR
jgi:hypothetical protein